MTLRGGKQREASDGKLYIVPESPHVRREEVPFCSEWFVLRHFAYLLKA